MSVDDRSDRDRRHRSSKFKTRKNKYFIVVQCSFRDTPIPAGEKSTMAQYQQNPQKEQAKSPSPNLLLKSVHLPT